MSEWLDKHIQDAHDSLPRVMKEKIAALTARAEQAEAELRDRKDNQDRYFMEWRGLDPDYDKICVRCGGAGTRTYGDTATRRGGIGGQALTTDVCDRCWGSGNESKPWPSRRELAAEKAARERAEQEVVRLREALKGVIDVAEDAVSYAEEAWN